MNYYTYKAENGKEYPFHMSYGAMKDIEIEIAKQTERMGDPEVAKAVALVTKLNKDGIDEDTKAELTVELLPYSGKLKKAMNSVDPVELAYILLKNAKGFRDVSKDEFMDLVDEITETEGFENMISKFKEVKDKVFTLMETIDSPKEKPAPPEVTKKKNIKA